ncbi:MAG: response regulator [Candidatus Omnitrophota bacterium]|jgi:two-component system alkaline phosphatase synthesis response regulator PhoP|nr:response regulator [Candidatus Omnitrophota bacterium]MDD5526431.1 response regulator [Candidatus Omnitrophota bacterium]
MIKHRVMIIDDEINAVDLLKHRLESEGYQVLALLNAKEIISEVHRFLPDIIILDLLMPELGGLDACEMLNKDPVGQSTPIIVVSGLNKDIDKKKAYVMGIQEYFVKPVDIEVLLQAIRKYIKEKEEEG